MILIKTYLKEVPQKGIGLFSYENIPKGKIVWEEDEKFSRIFSDIEFDKLNQLSKDYIIKYATKSFDEDKRYFLDLDNSRFLNHSYNPNIIFKENYGFALTDIKADYELTCDYSSFGNSSHIDFTKYI